MARRREDILDDYYNAVDEFSRKRADAYASSLGDTAQTRRKLTEALNETRSKAGKLRAEARDQARGRR